MRWIIAARVREARRLLEVSDLSVEDVAARSGLGTAANLRLHLARDAGTTPTAYRRLPRPPARDPRPAQRSVTVRPRGARRIGG